MRHRHNEEHRSIGAVTAVMATVVAVVVLVAGGLAYRYLVRRWKMSADNHIELCIPLSRIPARIGNWEGQDLEIEAGTLLYMERNFADDYVNRRYVNLTERLGGNLYVVYCATRLSGIIGHRPQRCYPGSGWIWESTISSQVVSWSGRTVDCLIHCFRKPAPTFERIYVLNYYVLNGRVTLSEKDFSGWLGRRPNLAGDPARYVAQVQVSSVTEQAAKALASDIADVVFAHLPDQDGRVLAAEASDEATPFPEAAGHGE
ncbi:MAG TPA: exosortase-associated EpsI family protein [Sedimentisphaerales bacterium]|nr:exosortase-associated EpsI family protein [Sedimentisphaerales bacterium]